jgi:hypothetical protein
MANLTQQQLDMFIATLVQNAGGRGAVGTGVAPGHNTVHVAPTGNPMPGNTVPGLWNMGSPGINTGPPGGINPGTTPGMPTMGLQGNGMIKGMTGYGIPGGLNCGVPPGPPPPPPPPPLTLMRILEGPGADAGYVAKAFWKLGPTEPAQIAQILE